jgi:hypothetical protein
MAQTSRMEEVTVRLFEAQRILQQIVSVRRLNDKKAEALVIAQQKIGSALALVSIYRDDLEKEGY